MEFRLGWKKNVKCIEDDILYVNWSRWTVIDQIPEKKSLGITLVPDPVNKAFSSMLAHTAQF